jgi:FkbM family methyltransferase
MDNENMIQQLFSKSKIVYDSLMDEKSKKIFSLRILYNLTYDLNYIKDMVSYMPELKFNRLHPYLEFLAQCKEHTLEHRRLVIYGAGNWGKHIYNLFNHLDWHCFCDNDINKQKTGFCNLPVISKEQLVRDHKDDIVVIGTLKYKEEIYNELIMMGFNVENILSIDSEPYSFIHFLNDKQYFEESIIEPQNNEVFVDAGCFDCGNSLSFRKWCDGEYEKIYAFEPDPSNYEKCKEIIQHEMIEKIELFNAGLWSKKDVVSFNAQGDGGSAVLESGANNVNVVRLDEILRGQRVSFIKMDIEGAELEALKGARDIITAHRPKLAICIYHKPEDILEIPLYLQSLIPDYKFYIRHYSNYTIETVLYAI